MGDLVLDRGGLGSRVPGGFHLVGDVAVERVRADTALYSSTRFCSFSFSCRALPGSAAQKNCWYWSVPLGGATGSHSARTVSSASSRSSFARSSRSVQQPLDVLLVVAVERVAGVVGDAPRRDLNRSW